MTAVPNWQPGTLYQPNALVVPRASTTITSGVLDNGNFEDGDTGWIIDSPPYWAIKNTNDAFGAPFQGTYYAQFAGPTHGSINVERQIVNTKIVPVTPGQIISLKAMIASASRPADGGAAVAIFFWDASSPGGYGSPGAVLVQRQGASSTNYTESYQPSTYTSVAPPGAAYAQYCVNAYGSNYPVDINIDACSWDYAGITPPTGLVFKAVQADAATSASTEPVWPTVLGNTVVDGGVTWEAVQTTEVTWQASPILVSGSTEPTWSTDIGGTVADNTIGWKAISRQITDAKCPNTIPVAIAASKIFAGDKDIIPFSETVNPLDWSTPNDAGYLPFGLQTYGSSPVTALGLYRSNLVAFNAAAFQMWQVDQDPANMALLDAVPVGCTYPQSVQPFMNDLAFLSAVGVRNVGIAGASTNLQAGGIGQPIDPLVLAKIRARLYQPISISFPAAGQYWLIFGPEAFVLTVTGAKNSSWSRYVFPYAITDWTILGADLYLRANNLVWQVSVEALYDDVIYPSVSLVAGGGGSTEYSLTAGTLGFRIGFTQGSDNDFGTLAPDTYQSYTISVLTYNSATSSLTVQILNDALLQNAFDTVAITGDNGLQTFNTSDATFTPLPGQLVTWYWPGIGPSFFTDGISYPVNLAIVGTEFGYDPFNSLGSVALDTMVNHTLLKAVYDTVAKQFTIWLSGVNGEFGSFSGINLYKGSDLNTRTLIDRYDVSSATTADEGSVILGMTTYTGVASYTWDLSANPLQGITNFAVDFIDLIDEQTSIDFTGTIQWPHLDMGQIGLEKNMIGIDLVSTAPTGVTFSIGYDQRDLTKRTAPYAIDPDTLPGPLLPMPVSGPSFDLKLEFAAGQAWEHIASTLYVK